MTEGARDGDVFSRERPRLLALAYRMTGLMAEAEDLVQEAYLRWRAAEHVESDRAFLTTVVTRLCLDYHRSARARRETYVGPWLPEPVRTDTGFGATIVEPDPHSLAMAFLVVLDTLTALERAAYLLHDVFDYSHAEVAAAIERDAAAVRQLVHRAREKIRAARPVARRLPQSDEPLVRELLAACTAGDPRRVESLLARDVVLRSDGGGKAAAARRPIAGSEAVAAFLVGITAKAPPHWRFEIAEVNGQPALIAFDSGEPKAVLCAEVHDGAVAHVGIVVNPDKLRHLVRAA